MLDKIEALRKESKAKRNRVAFLGAIISTLVIALVWGISLPSRFESAFNTPPEKSDTDIDGTTAADRLSVIRDYFNENLSEVETQAELLDAANQPATSSVSVPTESASSSASLDISTTNNMLNGTTSTTTDVTTGTSTSASTTIQGHFQ